MNSKQGIRNRSLGKTAQFGASYMDHVWLVLQLNEGVKTNELLLYFHNIHLMPVLFFSYDCQNYACYLTMSSVLLANIDDTHPGALDLLKRGAISVAGSMIPGSREDVSRTIIEETIMEDSKAHSGASGTGISGTTICCLSTLDLSHT